MQPLGVAPPSWGTGDTADRILSQASRCRRHNALGSAHLPPSRISVSAATCPCVALRGLEPSRLDYAAQGVKRRAMRRIAPRMSRTC